MFGQSAKLINSYEQSWAGGVAGHHGAHYRFILEFSGFRPEAVPDTIWLEGSPYALKLGGNMNVQLSKTMFGMQRKRYTIGIGTSHWDYQYMSHVFENKSANGPISPKNYKGPALVSYKAHGREEYFEIKNIMEHGPPISYP
jgi:hypothetical protein